MLAPAGSEDDQLTMLESLKAVLQLTSCSRCVQPPCGWRLVAGDAGCDGDKPCHWIVTQVAVV